MRECDITIPVWNQLAVTKGSINSIIKNTRPPYRLIVIDNASDSLTEDYLKNLKMIKDLKIILIRNDKNLGFVKAVNQGIRESSAPYVCIMNNDTIAADGWLEELIDVMEANPRIGLLNPSSNTSGQFPSGESIDDYARRLKHFKGSLQELHTCRGFCMLLRRSVLDKLGALDESYHFGYFDDTDYCKRAQGAGFRTARAKASYVYHRENTSFSQLEDNKTLFAANEKIFFKRWGRHVRVAYFVDRINSADKIDDIATDVARAGHQILIFLKSGLSWPVGLDHFEIRRVDVKGLFFGLFSVYKVFKYKKKKKLEVLLTDNVLFGKALKMLKGLHGSLVIINPDKRDLLKILETKSKDF